MGKRGKKWWKMFGNGKGGFDHMRSSHDARTTSEYLLARGRETGQNESQMSFTPTVLAGERQQLRQQANDTFYVDENEFIVKGWKVYVPKTMFATWGELADAESTEWQAYLVGHVEHIDGFEVYVIEDFYFPPQTGSGGHCTNVEEATTFRPGTIGHLHSHVKMNVFWSGTDRMHANWTVEIVVNAKCEVLARARVKLDNGRFFEVDAKVFTTRDNPQFAQRKDELDAALREGEAISEAKRKERQGTVTVGYHTTAPASLPAAPKELLPGPQPDDKELEILTETWGAL